MTSAPASLQEVIEGSPYRGYTYSYPHKTSHRSLSPPQPLDQVWASEDRDALFLYVHVPFCEMRCGFCNLFTTTGADDDLVQRYVDALRRQAGVVREQLGAATVARMAIGGGTPTFLSPDQLDTVLAMVVAQYGADPHRVPTSVETSPKTATPERLAVLAARGVERISIGVQSFDDAEAHGLGRPQRSNEVARALAAIRDQAFPILNIDLMYGGAGQTVPSWLASIDRALEWKPEELYLYPLYVRQLTGLAKLAHQWDDERLAAYRVGRDHLLSHGYRQVSMRMFRRDHLPESSGPAYRCEQDGMVGLGAGARSYTRHLHYSWPYAVERAGVRRITGDYINRSEDSFGVAHYGVALDAEDQRRRFVLLSLLQSDGLRLADYRQRFGADVFADLPLLDALVASPLAEIAEDVLALTDAGLERSDAIGPWLYSSAVRTRMEAFAWS